MDKCLGHGLWLWHQILQEIRRYSRMQHVQLAIVWFSQLCIDHLVQGRGISSALTLEIPQVYTNPSIYHCRPTFFMTSCTGYRWIPLRKVSDAQLWCFLWYAPEQIVEQTIETLLIWDAIAPIMTSLQCMCYCRRLMTQIRVAIPLIFGSQTAPLHYF